MAAAIVLIRHGEKPAPGLQGVNVDGTASEHSLITRGWQRAGALARLLVPRPGQDPVAGLPVPEMLFAASPKAAGADPREKSRREEETITPTADLIGIDASLEYGKGEEEAVAARVRASAQPVLIVWEHENIPKLARAIAPECEIPTMWPDERFDMVWLFRPDTQGGFSFVQIPQLLLAGDSPDPIA